MLIGELHVVLVRLHVRNWLSLCEQVLHPDVVDAILPEKEVWGHSVITSRWGKGRGRVERDSL